MVPILSKNSSTDSQQLLSIFILVFKESLFSMKEIFDYISTEVDSKWSSASWAKAYHSIFFKKNLAYFTWQKQNVDILKDRKQDIFWRRGHRGWVSEMGIALWKRRVTTIPTFCFLIFTFPWYHNLSNMLHSYTVWTELAAGIAFPQHNQIPSLYSSSIRLNSLCLKHNSQLGEPFQGE